MVPISALWLPVLVSAVIVFIASSIIHMVLPYHRSDMRRAPDEDGVLDALRRLNVPPGDYGVPHPGSMEGMKKPEFIEKVRKGPIVYMTVSPGRNPGMGSQLALWFVFCAIVNLFGGYIAGAALPLGAPYLEVFRFVGTTAFAGYALGQIPDSIWYQRSWATTLKNVFDGLVYGCLAGGTFGWLWPR